MGITIKHITLAFIFIMPFLSQNANGQSSEEHLGLQEKYWNYRERFKKTHINIGVGQNKSTPLNLRFHYQETSQITPNYVTPNCDSLGDGVMIGTSDNTLMDLGDYIAVLSTEIALLKHNNQSYHSTMQELYFALAALNRLDRNSDSYLDPILGANLDGRFMRDDHNMNSTTNWVDYDSTKYIHSKAYKTFENHVDWTYPHQGNCNAFTYEYKNIMSKDEIVGMLWGLAFVKKYVPNEFVDNGSGSDGFKIVDEAVAIANRTMTYLTNLQSHSQKCGVFNWNMTIQENWKILYPLVNYNGKDNTFDRDDLIGNDFFTALSPAIVMLGNYITGGSYSHVKVKTRTRWDNNHNWAAGLCKNDVSITDDTWLYEGIIRALAVDRNNPSEMAALASNYFASFVMYPPDQLHLVISQSSLVRAFRVD
ncbi:MAG: hypothetical protein ACK417_11785 [Bacteroidia bacterium]